MKKWFPQLFFAAIFCLLVLPVSVSAADVVASGYCGGDKTADYDEASNSYQNVTWTLDSDGLLTISGNGIMKDYENFYDYTDKEQTPWYDMRVDVHRIVIDSGITKIGNFVFYDCNTASVSIASTVNTIGTGAFVHCQALTEIIIPDSVTDLGESAFLDCIILSQVTLSNSINVLKANLFGNCSSLRRITIPQNVTQIDGWAIWGCTSLEEITILGNIADINNFNSCTSLTAINVSEANEHFRSINGVVFSKDQKSLLAVPRGLTGSYIIPGGVTNIGDNAFAYCKKLTGVTVPSSVIEIGSNAFYDTNIVSLSIPGKLTSINNRAFYFMTKLVEIELPATVESIGDEAFASCTSLSSILLPNSVSSINAYAFGSCTALRNITLPASVTSIGNGCFDGCQGLNHIIFEGNAPAMGESVFGNRDAKTISIEYSEAATGWDNEFWADYTLSPQHSWGDWTILSEPTEEEAGVRKHTCATCDTVEEEYFDYPSDTLLPRIRGIYLDVYDFTVYGWMEPNVTTNISVLSTTGEDILDKVKISVIDSKGVVYDGTGSQGAFCTYYDRSSHTIVAGNTCYADDFTIKAEAVDGLSRGNSRTVVVHVARDYSVDNNSTANIRTDDGNRDVFVIPGSGADVTKSIIIENTFRDRYEGPIGVCLYDENVHIIDGCSYNNVEGYVFSNFSGNYGITFDYETRTVHIAQNAVPGTYHVGVTKLDQDFVVGGEGIGIKEVLFSSTPLLINSIAYTASADEVSITGCSGPTKDIVLPEVINGSRVTAIAENAFSTRSDMTSIVIPKDVTMICENAFSGCNALSRVTYEGTERKWQSITIQDGNEKLRDSTLNFRSNVIISGIYGSTSFSLDAADNTLIIHGPGALPDAPMDWVPWKDYRDIIEKIVVEDGVTRIGDWIFSGCANLTDVDIPASVTDMGVNPFAGCTSLESIKIAVGSIFRCLNGVLYNESSNRLICCLNGLGGVCGIPEGITEISRYAFYGCTGLTGVTIPESVTNISDFAFYGCTGLTTLSVPKSVTSISVSAFVDCSSMTSLEVSDENLNYKTINGVLYDKEISSLLYCPAKREGAYVIPGSVTTIGDYAFSGCDRLTDVTISTAVIYIGDFAFSGCASLADIHYDGTRTMWNGITKYSGNEPLYSAELHVIPLTIIWLNGDDTELDRKTYYEDDNTVEPTTEKIPTKEENEIYRFSFNVWGSGVLDGAVKTYTPEFFVFEKTLYTVIWLNDDGSELDRSTFRDGSDEPVTSKVPVKAENEYYIYTFVEWDDGTEEGTIITYRPLYSTTSKYVVVWLNGDGSELDRKNYLEGEDEPVTDKVPTKSEDDDYYYIFSAWSDGATQGNVKTYSAQFTPMPKQVHHFSSEWSMDDVYHWHDCTDDDCDAISDKAMHAWDDGEVTKAADYGIDGVMTYTCTVCGHNKTETIPALTYPYPFTISMLHVSTGKVTVDIVNHTGTTGKLLVAAYTETGRFIAIGISDVTSTASSIDVAIDTSEAAKVSAFIVDNLVSLKPLCEKLDTPKSSH